MRQYNNLQDIEAKRAELRKLADRRQRVCGALWHGLTHKEEETAVTPTQKLLKNANKAAGIFDGVMFGVKLYKTMQKRKKEGKEKKKKHSFFSFFKR